MTTNQSLVSSLSQSSLLSFCFSAPFTIPKLSLLLIYNSQCYVRVSPQNHYSSIPLEATAISPLRCHHCCYSSAYHNYLSSTLRNPSVISKSNSFSFLLPFAQLKAQFYIFLFLNSNPFFDGYSTPIQLHASPMHPVLMVPQRYTWNCQLHSHSWIIHQNDIYSHCYCYDVV